MRYQMALVAVLSSLFLVGCSNSEPGYDPIELIEYENCINNIPDWVLTDYLSIKSYKQIYCDRLKPKLK